MKPFFKLFAILATSFITMSAAQADTNCGGNSGTDLGGAGLICGAGNLASSGGVAAGTNNTANLGGVAIGSGTSGSNGGVAIGSGTSGQNGGVAIGNGAGSSTLGGNLGAVAIGVNAQAGSSGVVIGSESSGSGVAIGTGSTAALVGVAVGHSSSAPGFNATAIGPRSSAAGEHSVALGFGATATEDAVVSVGNGGGVGTTGPATRRITNVATGVNANDAVNVQQLNAAIANVGGGGGTVDAIARGMASSAQLTADTAQSDATDALTGLAHDSIARTGAATAQTAASAAQVIAASAQVTASSAQTTAASAQASSTAAHTRIDAHDAVLVNHESRITALEAFPPGSGIDQVARDRAESAHQRIDQLDKKASQGVAAALAANAAMPAGVDLMPGETAMNVGVGVFSSQTALAMGWARRLKSDEPFIRNAVVRGAIAVTSGRAAVSAGIGWKW